MRLTREQNKERTRQRLLDGARAVFVTKGFAFASIEDLVAASGYTRGAFYSNFRDKTELLLEVLKRDHDRILAILHLVFEVDATSVEIETCVLRYYSEYCRNNDSFLLWTEAKLWASRNAHFRAIFNALLSELHRRTASYIVGFYVRVDKPLPMPADQLAFALIAFCNGMQFFYALDPQNITDELAESVLATLFRRVVFGTDAPA